MAKNVQIPSELFYELVRYFILEDTTEQRKKAITDGLEDKILKMYRHETFTNFKISQNDEERKKFLEDYIKHSL